MRNPFKSSTTTSAPTPAPQPVVINRPTLCGCCQKRRTTNGVCDECANGACATFGH